LPDQIPPSADRLIRLPALGLLFGWLLAQALALPDARPRNAPM
jgi:hypothetical protein